MYNLLYFKATRYFILCGVILLFAACSSNHLSVSDEKWNCNKENKIRHCLVTFKVTNSSHFPIDAKIRIRVHKRGYVNGSDAMTNNVVFEKPINKTINPKSSTEFKENIKIKGSFTNVGISAWGDEV